MKLVIIESPFAGEVATNILYARECLAHSLRLGEAPIAFHLLYTQVLDDLNSEQRAHGIHASRQWYSCASLVAVYADLGISPGMKSGISYAKKLGIEAEWRFIRGQSYKPSDR